MPPLLLFPHRWPALLPGEVFRDERCHCLHRHQQRLWRRLVQTKLQGHQPPEQSCHTERWTRTPRHPPPPPHLPLLLTQEVCVSLCLRYTSWPKKIQDIGSAMSQILLNPSFLYKTHTHTHTLLFISRKLSPGCPTGHRVEFHRCLSP